MYFEDLEKDIISEESKVGELKSLDFKEFKKKIRNQTKKSKNSQKLSLLDDNVSSLKLIDYLTTDV